MNRISQHISMAEAVKSQTAIRFRIDNRPDARQIERMKLLSNQVFEPLRMHFDIPIAISSFFRSPGLNAAIRGALNSQHMANFGAAMDIDAQQFGGISNLQVFDFVLYNLDFDQLIWEFGTIKEPDWVHVSYVSEGKNRNQVLRAMTGIGSTLYTPFK